MSIINSDEINSETARTEDGGTAYKPKQCIDCNKIYTPTGARQERCIDCGKDIKKEKRRQLVKEREKVSQKKNSNLSNALDVLFKLDIGNSDSVVFRQGEKEITIDYTIRYKVEKVSHI